MKREMETLVSGQMEPINWYYQFEAPEKPHPKVKVLGKNETIKGTYERTFSQKKGRVTFKSHLIKTENEGKITIKGCTVLDRLENLSQGTYVEITYLGQGIAKDGDNPPFLFNIKKEKLAAQASTAPAPLLCAVLISSSR